MRRCGVLYLKKLGDRLNGDSQSTIYEYEERSRMSAQSRHAKHLRNLALLAGVAGSFITFANAVQAKAPEVYFYPSKSWTIGPTGGDDERSAPRCLMVNEFNNGFVLGLDGVRQSVRHLNMDFRQDVFTPGQAYEATLSVPGRIMHKINGEAKTSSHLQLNIQGMSDFYNAMRQAAVLDINVEDNNFRFYLIGFTNNAPEFETCLAQRPPSAPAKSAPAKSTSNRGQPARATHAKAFELSMSDEDVPLHPDMGDQIEYAGETIPVVKTPRRNAPNVSPRASTQPEIMTPMPGEEIPQRAATARGAAPEEALDEPVRISAKQPAAEPVNLNQPRRHQDFELTQEQQDRLLKARRAKGQRMSEMIADEIEYDPSLIDVEGDGIEDLSKPPFMNGDDTGTDGTKVVREDLSANITTKTVVPDDAPDSAQAALSRDHEEAQKPKKLETPREVLDAPEQFIPEPGRYSKEELERIFAAKAQKQPVTDESAPEPVLETASPDNADKMDRKALEEAAQSPAADEGGVSEVSELPPLEEKTIKSQRVETPDVKVTREQYSGAADFTDLDVMERESAIGKRRQALSASMDYSEEQIDLIENKIQTLRAENDMLKQELEEAHEKADENSLDISSENWDLERATMRYQEAERQLQRMGEQLQRERELWNAERRELESLLYNPHKRRDGSL